jgi:hypothetical protein
VLNSSGSELNFINSILFLVILLFLSSCSGEENDLCIFTDKGCPVRDSKNSEDEGSNTEELGGKIGITKVINGYNSSNIKVITAELTPYELGLRIKFSPVTSSFVCSVSDAIIQGGNQFSFGSIADNKDEFDSASYYNGYIESGAYDSCATYQVDTTWVIFASKVGFIATSDYQVTLDDVTSDGFTAQTVSITINN